MWTTTTRLGLALVSLIAVSAMPGVRPAVAELRFMSKGLSGGQSAGYDFETKNQAVVIVTVSGRAWSDGTFRSSVEISIDLNGKLCAQDQSFVPVNWAVEHKVSATCAEHVGPGKYWVKAYIGGEGIKGESRKLSGKVIVIEP